MSAFDYETAFKRNIGLVSKEEQGVLRRSCAAIIGLGGMGGTNALMLARMGFGRFYLADFDTFSQANFNRQTGATMKTVGRPKAAVIAELIRDINPEAEVSIFEEGLLASNVEPIVGGADLIVDSVDFFAVDARELLYPEARRRGRPVLCAAPMGFSGTLHVFTPGGMTFEDYFDIRPGMPVFEKLIAFAAGLFPRATHWGYMNADMISITERTGPSLFCACHTAAGLLGTEALALILKRRRPEDAPHYVQLDPFTRRYVRGRLLWGNRGPLQRLKRWVLARRFRHLADQIPPLAPATISHGLLGS